MDEKLINALLDKRDEMQDSKSLDVLKKASEDYLKSKGIPTEINIRYKDDESIMEALERKGYTEVGQMKDLMRIEVITETKAEIGQVKMLLLSRFSGMSLDHDYYADGENENYKAIHMHGKDIQGNGFEIQVKDKLEAVKQKFCHDRIYKNPAIDQKAKPKLNRQMRHYIEKVMDGKYLEVPKLGQALDLRLENIFIEELSIQRRESELAAGRTRGVLEIDEINQDKKNKMVMLRQRIENRNQQKPEMQR